MIAHQARILIVDDDEVIRDLLSQRLQEEGYMCEVADNGSTALAHIELDSFHVMLADIRMPQMDGYELLTAARDIDPDMQVIMVTGIRETTEAVKAMKLGAYDYVMKPFDLEDVVHGVRRALEKQELKFQNRLYHKNLENRVREATKELIEKNRQIQILLFNTITSFVNVLEAKDKYTEGHSKRVAESAVKVARTCTLTRSEIENMRLAGLLHDIGKVGIREKTLQKPGALTAEEYDEVKQHPLIAERILEPIEELHMVLRDIKHHHERYDGMGYPAGLRGEEIPFGARILALSDTYDAMTSERPYRSAFSHEQALKEIEMNAGKQFDPELVAQFLMLYSY
ncbi:MAG: response regulator [Gemmatimonadota bacterium]|nr:MAG: response regulator [Gemmatimonadota bacterium]